MYGYFVSCSYDGGAYAGSQAQANTAHTIQTQLERAFARILRQEVQLQFSSRTDAGVHAVANVLSFALPRKIDDSKQFLRALNAVLPEDIALHDLRAVPLALHPRFTALSRRYRYNLHTRKNPLCRDYSWFYPYALRPELLQSMAKRIEGRRDFASFAKKHSPAKHYECHLLEASWNFAEGRISLELEANRFVRGMVRALVGTMLYLDRRGRGIEDFCALLHKPMLASAPMWAPAIGLTLVAVKYPPELWQS